jgi:hypothetical protein
VTRLTDTRRLNVLFLAGLGLEMEWSLGAIMGDSGQTWINPGSE